MESIRHLCPGCEVEPPLEARALSECPGGPSTMVLGQSWRDVPEPPFRPAEVRCAWVPSALLVYAELRDEDIFNHASVPNERTWELGDVFEIFLQSPGNSSYIELHVTPRNVRSQFFFARVGEAMRPLEEGSFLSRTQIAPHEGLWRVAARIPATLIPPGHGFSHGHHLRASFCRYDAFQDGRPPVLSSSSPHPIPKFHRPGEWPHLVFERCTSTKNPVA